MILFIIQIIIGVVVGLAYLLGIAQFCIWLSNLLSKKMNCSNAICLSLLIGCIFTALLLILFNII